MYTLKNRFICMLAIISIISTYITAPAYASVSVPKVGEIKKGFAVTAAERAYEYNGNVIVFEHQKTGAKVVYCANDDTNRTFSISFKTPPENDKGTSHIFEHSTLSGSEKYPSSTLFMKLSNQTYNTYMNAVTGSTCTTYPVSSLSEKQLFSLTDYYLDSVFNPMLYTDKTVFDREAWHYEMNDANSPLTVSGTVYSEMKGAADITAAAYQNTIKAMFPDSAASYESGGSVYDIPKLTYEEVVDYHKTYYHPSNSLTLLYGDLDYESFLVLLDNYFSKYDKKEFNIDFKSYTETEKDIEMSFDYPVSSNTKDKTGSVLTYAFECKDATPAEIEALDIAVDLLLSTEYFSSTFMKDFSSASVSAGVCTYTSQPMVVFMFDGVKKEDAAAIKKLVDYSINYITKSLSSSMKDSLIGEYEHERLAKKHGSLENRGVELAITSGTDWSATDNELYTFERNEVVDNIAAVIRGGQVYKATEKFLGNKNTRKALITTNPSVGMKDTLAKDFEKELAEKKESMTEDEINAIVENTKQYRKDASNKNVESDKDLIKKLNVVSVNDLPEKVNEYTVSEKVIDDIKFINTVSDSPQFGRGKVMIDVSNVPVEDLKWLSLYGMLLGNFETTGLDSNKLYMLTHQSMIYDIDFETVKADNANGFTPYLLFKYQGNSEKSADIFNVANQMLFHTKFSDEKMLKKIISYYADVLENSKASMSESILINSVYSSVSDEAAYNDLLSGASFIEEMSQIKTMANEDISMVIEKLENIQKLINHRTGMVIVYAGSETSINTNNNYALSTFKTLPAKQQPIEDYTNLKSEYKNRAVIADTDVNSNGIYAPMEKLGIKYDEKANVILSLVTDKFLMPELRNKHNAYAVSANADEFGIGILSQRDPELVNTFYTYSKIGDMLEESDITQDDVNQYIMSVYSDYTLPHADLYDAYWTAANYLDGITAEKRISDLKNIKSTTVADVKNYSKVFRALWDEGVIFTAGNTADVLEHRVLYDEIINPADVDADISVDVKIPEGDGVKVMINDTSLVSDVPAQIVDGRTLVPLRAIFEALDMSVSWDSQTSTVTAVGDGISIEMTIGKNEFYKDDDTIKLDVPAQIIDGRTMVPVRAISESLGCIVNWDGANQLVTVIK